MTEDSSPNLQAEAEKRKPTHGVEPELQEIKLQLRQAAAEHLPEHKTILDLFAGEGNISELYKPLAQKLILVDDDEKKLAAARRRLGEKNIEYHSMNNLKFMEEILPSIQDLTLVDFDPYGSVGKHLQAFFASYEVKHPFILSLTDGATKDIRGIMQNDAWREHYLSDRKEVGKYDWPDLIESLLGKLGSKHDFEIRRLNGTWSSDYGAWYASYLISPRRLEKAMADLSGLYLVEPHPRWMWTGEKKAIVKSIKLQAHIDEPLYLLGEYVYGIITLKAPEEISLKQFEELRDLHRISEAERKKWWPDAEKLYLYRYEWVEKFDPPREYELQPGTQIFVGHVVFKAPRVQLTFLGTRGEITVKAPRHQKHSSLLLKADSAKLLIDHGEDHRGSLKEIEPDWILLTHAHPDHAFGLKNGTGIPVRMSQDSAKALAKFVLLKPGIFKDYEAFSLGPFKITPHPVVHSTRAPAHGFRIEAGHHVIAYFPDQLEIKKVDEALRGVDLYIGDGAHISRDIRRFSQGKPIGHASMMKQTKIAQEHGIEQIIFTHLGEQPLGQGKELDGIVEGFGARVAYDGMVLTLDEAEVAKAYLTRCKPAYRIFELKDLEEIKAFQDSDEELEISVKWDGERLQIHKTGEKVAFYSDMPRDVSSRLPVQIKEVSQIVGDFALDAEAVMLDVEKKEAFHRSMVVAFLNAKTDPEPTCEMLHCMVFDVLRHEGKDLRNRPLEDRQKILSKFKNTDHIHFILPERDHGKEALAYIVKRSDPDFEKLVARLAEH